MTEGLNATAPDSVRADNAMPAPEGGTATVHEAVLVDRLIDLLLAVEPFEVKQGDTGPVAEGKGGGNEPSGCAADTAHPEMDGRMHPAGRAGQTATADIVTKPSAESTRAMLGRMRAVLDREAARLGEDGLEGKAAVDQVALIARTLEKIDQMERLIAEDANRASGERLSGEEREQMRRTVRQLILSAAERMVAERVAESTVSGAMGGDGDAPAACEVSESSDPADAGSLDPGSGPG
ncbi:hypothetical protein [Hoeflea sp.]|uniref:hypothetical protein n=1 Tax=Hoeflea sp. TaxID=1940281 RepID=UPI003B52AD60